MNRDLFEVKRVDIERPFIDINDKDFSVNVSNYGYWSEDLPMSTYNVVRETSFVESPGYSGGVMNPYIIRSRRISGPEYRYVDIIREGEIKKISSTGCCMGTVEDTAYENRYNGKRENEEFNYQINNPPTRREYIKGDTVNVSGYLYKAPCVINYTDKGINILDVINSKNEEEYVYFETAIDFENVKRDTEFRNTFFAKQKDDIIFGNGGDSLTDLINNGEKVPTSKVSFIKNSYYKIDLTVFRFSPHYVGGKFYHGYTLISNIEDLSIASLYPKSYKIEDWDGSVTILDESIYIYVLELKSCIFPEIYSNKQGLVATFTDDFTEGDLVIWNTDIISHYDSHYLINRVKKIYKTKRKNERGFTIR